MGRRNKVAVIAVATVVVLAALGVAGWRLTRSDETASATPEKSQPAKPKSSKRSASTTSKPRSARPGERCGWIRACKPTPATGPTVVPGKGEVNEGDSESAMLEIPVLLYGESKKAVTVRWRTLFAEGVEELPQATPFEDYIEKSGTVTFEPGQTSQQVQVPVNGNTGSEKDEFLLVSFLDAKNARMGGVLGLGAGFILNDD